MGSEQGGLRAVLDTNTVLSSLLFDSGRLTWIRDGWARRRFVPLCSSETTEELLRALAYPKFKLGKDEIRVLVGSYLSHYLHKHGLELAG